MRLFPLVAAITACFLSNTQALSSQGSKVLAVTEKDSTEFTSFFESLTRRGFQLDIRTADSASHKLFEFDAAVYSHLLLLDPYSKSLSEDLSPQSLFRFLSDGGNIVTALAPNATETHLAFAREFNLEFDLKTTLLIDHYFFDPKTDDGSHTSLKLPWISTHSVAYKGLAHYVPAFYPLATVFLSATPTSYSYETNTLIESDLDGSGGPNLAGTQASLVTGIQTLSNSRIVFSGSLDLFKNQHYQENEAFLTHLTKWTFQEEGVLKIDSVSYKKVGEDHTRKDYRIRDDMIYTVVISQYKDSQWQPVNLPDLQLEVRLLDPYYRIPLSPSSLPTSDSPLNSSGKSLTSTTYQATFKLPDKHGVFTFLLSYKRSNLNGQWTFLEHRSTVAVTPPRHDEFQRFINSAWPYYLSAISTSLFFLIFVAMWLGLSVDVKGKGKQE